VGQLPINQVRNQRSKSQEKKKYQE